MISNEYLLTLVIPLFSKKSLYGRRPSTSAYGMNWLVEFENLFYLKYTPSSA
jgi:hypothetical protein